MYSRDLTLYFIGILSFQYYDPCSWDSYSPDGTQSQYGYGLSEQEANYFGKKEKERSEKKKNKSMSVKRKGMTLEYFDRTGVTR